MKLFKDKKDKKAWFNTISNICGNLAAGWFGIVLFTAVFDLFVLTKSLVLGILFTWLSYKFEKKSL